MQSKNALSLISAAVALTLATAAHAQQAAPAAAPAAPTKAVGTTAAPAPATLAYGNPASAPVAAVKTEAASCKPAVATSCNDTAAAAPAKPKPVYRAPAKPVRLQLHNVIAPAIFDFSFNGDIQDALNALQLKQPQLTVLNPAGTPSAVPVRLQLQNVSLVDALRAIGEQGNNAADVIYNGSNHTARISYKAKNDMGTESSTEAKRWQSGGSARPLMGTDGLLQYPFGQAQPELTCAPLRACDIQLQTGEVINNVILGDTVRWIPAPAKTGEGVLATPHVIVKPTEAGLQTNLIITTNRRTYTLTLRSSEVNYVSRVGFYYPADMVQDWNGAAELAQRKADEDSKRKVSDMPIASIEQLNLDGYKTKGDRDLAWYPTRVFDDGTRVWIQMPASIKSNEAPALVLLDKNGDSELVNYRVKEADQGGAKVTYYIVDKLFERAGLIVGVGRDQRKVEIIKESRKTSSAGNWSSRFDNN